MRHSKTNADADFLAGPLSAAVADVRVLELLPRISEVTSTGEVMSLFREA